MLKKRTLLLGAALAAFGATAISGAFAFGAVNTSDTSEDVDVIDPVNPVFDAVQTANAIVADNNWPKVADLKHSTSDTNYTWNLTDLAIAHEGSQINPACGLWDYAMTGAVNSVTGLAVVVPAAPASTGYDLFLKIPAAGTDATCKVSGATVQATFVIP